MKSKYVDLITIAVAWIMFSVCGGRDKGAASPKSEDFLPGAFDSAGAERISEIRTFKGESLYEYIDGGAEIYQEYGFIEVSTANYAADDIEMIIDIYRFADESNAFGLYAVHRPPQPNLIAIGAEGFRTSLSVDFVKGAFYVRILWFEQSDRTSGIITALAAEIGSLLPGDDYLPEFFTLFPSGNPLPGTDMMTSASFLNMRFLTDVFSRKYTVMDDTVTLLVTDDPGGQKFARWFESGVYDGSVEPGPANLPFDDGFVLVTERTGYGLIVAGLKNERLMGIIGYEADKIEFLAQWLGSTP